MPLANPQLARNQAASAEYARHNGSSAKQGARAIEHETFSIHPHDTFHQNPHSSNHGSEMRQRQPPSRYYAHPVQGQTRPWTQLAARVETTAAKSRKVSEGHYNVSGDPNVGGTSFRGHAARRPDIDHFHSEFQGAALDHQYNSFQPGDPDGDFGKSQKAGGQYTSSISMGVSSGDHIGSINIDPFSKMAALNSRAMDHEHQLNQMHKNIELQFDQIKRDKHKLKLQKTKL